MTPITFDTRKAVRNLKAVGFEEPQADAIVDTLGDAFSDTVATKSDIAEVQSNIAEVQSNIAGVQSDIARLEVSTKSGIARLEVSTKAGIARLEVSTKSDIARLEVSTKADIARLEVSTKADIADLKADMFRALWIQGAALVGLQLTIAGLLFAALKLFSH